MPGVTHLRSIVVALLVSGQTVKCLLQCGPTERRTAFRSDRSDLPCSPASPIRRPPSELCLASPEPSSREDEIRRKVSARRSREMIGGIQFLILFHPLHGIPR